MTVAGIVGGVLLLGALAAVGATGAFVAALLRVRGGVAFALAAWTIGWSEVVAVSLLLSVPQWLRGATFGAAVVVLLAAACIAWVAGGRPRAPSAIEFVRALRSALGDRVVAVVAAVAASAYAYAFLVGVAIPELDWDVMTYHLPRAALWAQRGGVGYIADVPDVRLNGMPPHAEIGVLATMLVSGTDAYVWLVQFAAAPAAGLAAAGIGRRLGLEPPAAAFGGLAFLLFPVVLLQAPTALTDVAVVAPLAAAAYFALGTSRVELLLAGLALALALGTKFTALLALPLLVVVVFVFQPLRRWPGLALAGAAGVALGSYWYLLNLWHTGSVDGRIAKAFDQIPDRSMGETLQRAITLLFGFLDLSGVEGRERYLFPVVGASFAFAALAVARGRSRVAAVPLAATAVAVAAIPWLIEGVHSFGERAYFKAALILDQLSGNLDTHAPGTDAGPMTSWYGPAFAVLGAICVPLVVLAVRSRTVSAAAIVALAAPLLFAPLVAYAVVHDPIRGRLFAFPVAIAAATFGVALSVRAAAWGATALLTLTAALSLVHYQPRPAGVSLLEPVKTTPLWRAKRWQAQAAYTHPPEHSVDVFRFFATRLPPKAVVAVAAARNTYLYPIFDRRGRRKILFDRSGDVPQEAEWLVVAPGRRAGACASWQTLLETPQGWRVLRRAGAPRCRVAADDLMRA